MNTVLGLAPSGHGVGFAVLSDYELHAFGVWAFRHVKTTEAMAESLRNLLCRLIERENVSAIAIEEPGFRSRTSRLNEFRAVIEREAGERGIPHVSRRTRAVERMIVGSGQPSSFRETCLILARFNPRKLLPLVPTTSAPSRMIGKARYFKPAWAALMLAAGEACLMATHPTKPCT